MVLKYVVTTLGCKVNQYESQLIRDTLDSLGLQPTEPGEIPDLAAVNTCAVTSAALAKSRQAIRRLARGGRTSVVVIGCGAAADATELAAIEGVSATIDHNVDIRAELRRLLAPPVQAAACSPEGSATASLPRRHTSRGKPLETSIPAERADVALGTRPAHSPRDIVSRPLPLVKRPDGLDDRIDHFMGRHRAFLKVQDGCDAYCTYCIVPRLRPNLRSKPIDAAVAEARGLVRSGHKEIVITGIFLGAYGRRTAVRRRFAAGPAPLTRLVEALAKVDGLERLRISSLEPGDVDDSLLEIIASDRKCMPHLHLPLQSGSADILRRMKRQYSIDSFVDMIERVRRTLDRPAITTDIIVGFPGETERDFQASLEIASFAEFSKIHAFPYSVREGTPAARLHDQFVHPEVVRERMRRLGAVERECSLEFRRQFLGQTERVLVESDGRENPKASPQRDAYAARGVFHKSDNNLSRGLQPARTPEGDGQHGWNGQHGQPQADAASSGKKSRTHRVVAPTASARMAHGHSDRYFEVYFESGDAVAGDLVSVRLDRVTPGRTHGTCMPADSVAYSLPVLARFP